MARFDAYNSLVVRVLLYALMLMALVITAPEVY